ncbi:serine protease F56F10.1, partial [Aphelenchoides avenae]
RFWHNYPTSGGPQFLCLGGEDSVDDPGSACGYTIHVYAEAVNASVWVLEHRFYGYSRPFPDLKNENLVYLTSSQALEDAASFIEAQNKHLANPEWVVFGGSYSGNLALWFRQAHPELTVGAVGSSAPVEPIVDFYDYLKVVENELRVVDPDCPRRVKETFDDLRESMYSTEKREKLSSTFGIEPPLQNRNLTYDETNMLYASFTGIIGLIQGDLSQGQIICDAMKSGDTVWRLAQLLQPKDVSTDYSASIRNLQQVGYPKDNASVDDWERVAERAWIWQTCNEFGYFQSTGIGNSVFSSLVPLSFYVNLCTDIYGPEYNISYVQAAVDRTRKLYGGRENYRGTNVVIPNGSLDPWHALGFYGPFHPVDESAVVYLINGTTHCGDMMPWGPGSPDGLKEVQGIIQDNIKRWLSHNIINATSEATASENDSAKTNGVGAIAFDEPHRDNHL